MVVGTWHLVVVVVIVVVVAAAVALLCFLGVVVCLSLHNTLWKGLASCGSAEAAWRLT